MTSQRGDELVGVYMARLGAALARVPAERRDEIAGEIANHIAEERAQLAHESDADVRSLLERVGAPSDLAAAASGAADSDPTPRRIGLVEVLALVLIPIIWPVGVILLWLSPAWSTRDRVIGTVFSLGGYPAILILGPALLYSTTTASTCSTGTDMPETCTGVMALPYWIQVVVGVGELLFILLVLALPILVGIYLGARLRRWASRPAAAYA